jgi:hypothetical protein
MLSRLKIKEANIDVWQKNKIAQAREKMTNTEVCLATAFGLPKKDIFSVHCIEYFHL